jgi:phosphoserine phosphatase
MEALTAAPEPAFATLGRQPAGHTITVIRPVVSAELLGAVLHRLSTVTSMVTSVRTMATHPCTALEFTVRLDSPAGNAEAVLRAALSEIGARCRADIAVRRTSSRHRLVVFDVDSTLIRGEAIDVLAAHVGKGREVRQITERAMRGEVDFASSLRSRVSVLAGLPVAVADRLAHDLELTPGALVAVRALQARGIRVGAVSGGLTPVVSRLAERLGLDFFRANEPEVVDGRLTGGLAGRIVDSAGKAAALHHFAAAERVSPRECVAVGDGANDIGMISAAGLGIAFNAKPVVRAAADAVLSYPRLDLVLPLLGIPVPCAVMDSPLVA